jgi:hypothetical protein
MRENRTYGSVRGGGSNADRLLDSDMSAGVRFGGKAARCVAFLLRVSASAFLENPKR